MRYAAPLCTALMCDVWCYIAQAQYPCTVPRFRYDHRMCIEIAPWLASSGITSVPGSLKTFEGTQ